MDNRESPDPKPSLIVADPRRAHRRLAFRFRQGWKRLSGPAVETGPLWTAPMTMFVTLMIIATVSLFFLDAEINAAMRSADTPWRDFLVAWTDLARSQWYLVPAGLIIVVAGLWDWGHEHSDARRVWSHLYGQAFFVFASVAGALLTTNLLKIVFGRARPPLIEAGGAWNFDWLTLSHDFASFPSGHSTTAGAVTMILMLWLPRLRLLFLIVGVALGISRSAAEAHYPSDIVAGLTIGSMFTLTLARYLALRHVAFRLRLGRTRPEPRFRWTGETGRIIG